MRQYADPADPADPADLVEAKRWVDGVGHYSRPDVFRLHWDRSPKPPIVRE